ncbi:MAG: hypothetical protein PVH19_03370 [Planctomycetia bacterium]|jgi:flagellar basal-body rod protein FlgG
MRFTPALLILAAIAVFGCNAQQECCPFEDMREQQQQADPNSTAAVKTGRTLDVMIDGRGFLQVLNGDTGEIMYTRCGKLYVNRDGQLIVGSPTLGRLLEPAITIPENATEIQIDSEGHVSVKEPGCLDLSEVGQIEVATFMNPDGLMKLGENFYGQTSSSGLATQNIPSQEAAGRIVVGSLEKSKWVR